MRAAVAAIVILLAVPASAGDWLPDGRMSAAFKEYDRSDILPVRFRCRASDRRTRSGLPQPDFRIEGRPNVEDVAWLWAWGSHVPKQQRKADEEGYSVVERSRFGPHPQSECVLWHLRDAAVG